MVLASRVPTTPYPPSREIDELKVLDDNWETIRDEALQMAEMRRIRAADGHDIGFSSFQVRLEALLPGGGMTPATPRPRSSAPRPWPSSRRCPRSRPPCSQSCRRTASSTRTATLRRLAALPPGPVHAQRRRLPHHRGRRTPQLARRRKRGVRRNLCARGYNKTQQNRIILFCDVERPLAALGRGLQPLVRPRGDVGRQLAQRRRRPDRRHQQADARALGVRAEAQGLKPGTATPTRRSSTA